MTTVDPSIERVARNTIGAAIEVHRRLGPGFIESVYQKALERELSCRNIPHEGQYATGIEYRDERLGRLPLDLLVDDTLVVELKAVRSVEPIHRAQVVSYLKTTGLPLGLLLNFDIRTLKDGIHRVILSEDAAA